MARSPEVFVDGLDFAAAPRWRDGRLWYSDLYQRRISSVAMDGSCSVEHRDLDDQPSGLGWLPDGSLVVVAMTSRRLLRDDGGRLVEHADLSGVATGHCNDVVVDAAGNAYVGNFGFDAEAGDDFGPADLALVRADGSVTVAAESLAFPNGSVITPDGRTLVVGQTYASDFVAFRIADDATLHDRRLWAETPGMAPDGCAVDTEGCIWFADALSSDVVRIREGGEVVDRIRFPVNTYACTLGGTDGKTLFVVCAPTAVPKEAADKAGGVIYAVDVDVPHAGRP